MTVVNVKGSGNSGNGLFIDAGNIVYISYNNPNKSRVLIEENISIKNIFPRTSSNGTNNLFVTINGDIYASKKRNNYTIKWTKNSSDAVDVVKSSYDCFSLFIDTNNSIYCSSKDQHQILKASLANTTSSWAKIVGNNGSSGDSHTDLNSPHGIFVNTSLYLYVADTGNNRIQIFAPNSQTGNTVIINNTDANLKLSYPTDIIIDADGYLFILNKNGRQVIGSDSNGFRCLLGCRENGSQNTDNSQILQFDSYGNIFVLDSDGNIQRYRLLSNSCSKFIQFSYFRKMTVFKRYASESIFIIDESTTTSSPSSETSTISNSSSSTTTTTTPSLSSNTSTTSESSSTTTTTSSSSSETSTTSESSSTTTTTPSLSSETSTTSESSPTTTTTSSQSRETSTTSNSPSITTTSSQSSNISTTSESSPTTTSGLSNKTFTSTITSKLSMVNRYSL